MPTNKTLCALLVSAMLGGCCLKNNNSNNTQQYQGAAVLQDMRDLSSRLAAAYPARVSADAQKYATFLDAVVNTAAGVYDARDQAIGQVVSEYNISKDAAGTYVDAMVALMQDYSGDLSVSQKTKDAAANATNHVLPAQYRASMQRFYNGLQ